MLEFHRRHLVIEIYFQRCSTDKLLSNIVASLSEVPFIGVSHVASRRLGIETQYTTT